MYCGHARLCVCVSVCLSTAACPRYCTDPDVTWGSGRGCPLVVHYWADLQSVHGLRCYGNTMEMQSPMVICQAHRTLQACHTRTLRMPAKTPLTGDNMDAPAASSIPFCPYCGDVVTRARNFSEYMLVLALCLIFTLSSPVSQARQQVSYDHQLLPLGTEHHLVQFQHCLILQPKEQRHTTVIVIALI